MVAFPRRGRTTRATFAAAGPSLVRWVVVPPSTKELPPRARQRHTHRFILLLRTVLVLQFVAAAVLAAASSVAVGFVPPPSKNGRRSLNSPATAGGLGVRRGPRQLWAVPPAGSSSSSSSRWQDGATHEEEDRPGALTSPRRVTAPGPTDSSAAPDAAPSDGPRTHAAQQQVKLPGPALTAALLGALLMTTATFAAAFLGVVPPASARVPVVVVEDARGARGGVLVAAVPASEPSSPAPVAASMSSLVMAANDSDDPADAVAPASANTAPVLLPTAKLDGKDPTSKLFQQGRVLESQGNYDAAIQIYQKVTNLRPNFVYGWSNLGNAQVVFQDLDGAEASYSTAIRLCRDLEQTAAATSGETAAGGGFAGLSLTPPKCDDLYVVLLNRGCLRLNHNQPKEALADLELSSTLRARPDAVILQNLARAKELNGNYGGANGDYDVAIQMTSGDVSPFWLRSALVKYQTGNVKGGFDLLKRVRNRFPDAPEVKAAYAVFLYATQAGSNEDNSGASTPATDARQLFLEIPDRARLLFSDDKYVRTTIGWPPAMAETLRTITALVGDRP